MQKHVYVFRLFRHGRFPVVSIVRRLFPALIAGRLRFIRLVGFFGFSRFVGFVGFSRFFGFSRLIRLVGSFGIVPAIVAAVFAVRVPVVRSVIVAVFFAV